MTSHATFCLYASTQGICSDKPGVDEVILEEVFQVVGLNVGKGLENIPTLTTSITN